MTVATDVVGVTYIGNGATTAFSVPFHFLLNAHILLTRTVGAVETALTEGVDYTLTGAGNPSGGTASLMVALPFAAGLVIRRIVPLTQLTAFSSQGTFSPSLHEQALDKAVMVAQQLQQGQSDLQAEVATDIAAVNAALAAHAAADIAAMAALRAELAASGGGGGIGDSSSVLSTGSTTPRILADRFAEVRNVKDYGAVGNGTTNDTAAIQATINAAQGAGGGVVYFPEGTYAVCCAAGSVNGTNAALVLSESNVTLRGVPGKSKLKMFARGMLSPATHWETVQTAGLAAWQASHAYSLGAVVLANGHEWACSTAGTSASSGGPVLPGSPTPISGDVYVTDGTATWRYRDHMFVGHLLYVKKGINQNVDYLENIAFEGLDFDGNAGGWPDAAYPLTAGGLQLWYAGGWTEVTTGVVFDMWNKLVFFDGNLIRNVRFSKCKVHDNRAEGIYYGGSTMDDVHFEGCEFYHTGGSAVSLSAGMVLRECRFHDTGTLSESFNLDKDITYDACEFYNAINGIVNGGNLDISGSAAWGQVLTINCVFRNISNRAWTNSGGGDNYEIASCKFIDCGYSSSDSEAIRLSSFFGLSPANMSVHDCEFLADVRSPASAITLTGILSNVQVRNNFIGKTNRALLSGTASISRAINLGLNAGSKNIVFSGNRWDAAAGVHTSDETTLQYAGWWDDTNYALNGARTPAYSIILANGSNDAVLKFQTMYLGGNTNHAFNNVSALLNNANAEPGQQCRITSAAGNLENFASVSASSASHLLRTKRFLSPRVELLVTKDSVSGKWLETSFLRVTDRRPPTAQDIEMAAPNGVNSLAPLIEAYGCVETSLTPSGATNFNNWSNFLVGVPVRVVVNANTTIQHNAGGTNKLKLVGAADWAPGGTGGEIWFVLPNSAATVAYELYRVTY